MVKVILYSKKVNKIKLQGSEKQIEHAQIIIRAIRKQNQATVFV